MGRPDCGGPSDRGVPDLGAFAYIGSFAKGTAQVRNGKMTVYFEDDDFAGNVQEGMNVTVGETSSTILATGYDRDGKIYAQADTILEDGTYQASVNYQQTQVLSLLFLGTTGLAATSATMLV